MKRAQIRERLEGLEIRNRERFEKRRAQRLLHQKRKKLGIARTFDKHLWYWDAAEIRAYVDRKPIDRVANVAFSTTKRA